MTVKDLIMELLEYPMDAEIDFDTTFHKDTLKENEDLSLERLTNTFCGVVNPKYCTFVMSKY